MSFPAPLNPIVTLIKKSRNRLRLLSGKVLKGNTKEDPLFIQLVNDEIKCALIKAIAYIFGSGVPGELAEFGTMSGRTASVLAEFLVAVEKEWAYSDAYHKIQKRGLHLFDSFEGLPAPTHEVDAQSPHVQAQVWDQGMLRGLNPLELRNRVQQFLVPERVSIYEGFFSETLPLIPASTQFALVHIDCDYYESAVQVLEHLVSKHMLAKGAILLFDDWDCNQADPAFGERRAWQDILTNYQVSYSDQGSYSVFGHKFIIHQIG